MFVYALSVSTILLFPYKFTSLSMFTGPTKLVSWNCGGISGRDTVSHIKHLMRKLNLIVFCLVETRADDARLEKFVPKLVRNGPGLLLKLKVTRVGL